MIKRTIYKQIINRLEMYPVVVVTGPRQVGKSTEVYQLTLTHQFQYVTLDDIDERNLALNDPKFFIQSHGYPLIIDEIQYAPNLMEVIESIVNKERLIKGSANGLFVLTGSQTFRLMNGVTQSLAGRATILNMSPVSQNEIMEKEEVPFIPCIEKYRENFPLIDIQQLYRNIVRGFYPELYNNPKLPSEVFYSDYVNTYMDRDITQLINVKNKMLFHNFLQYIASLTSQQVNYSQISRNIGVDMKTIKEWISILETSGIIYLLQPYSEIKLTKRIVKSPKLYFCDTGLAAYLAKVYDSSNLMISNLSGAFMENYVMNEIKKSYENNGIKFDGYYYRDNNQNEIDLVLLHDLTLHLIEIKKGVSFNESHIKGFKQLENSQYTIGDSCVICNTETCYAIKKDVYVYPVTSI